MAKLSLLIDNPQSWFVPHGVALAARLRARGHDVVEVTAPQDIPHGDVTFYLSCEQIIKKDIRDRNKFNIVIHASALPKGKGWSPTTWQILEGKNEIPLTMFEAVDKVDAGNIYGTSSISLEGNELIDDVRQKEGEAIIRLAEEFVERYPNIQGVPQHGEESFYTRRNPKDSELNPTKTIAEQFDTLRIVDNERYPAFFTHRGHTYVLKIYKKEDLK